MIDASGSTQIKRVSLQRQVQGPTQVGQDHAVGFLEHVQAPPRHGQNMLGFLQLHLGADALGAQLLLPFRDQGQVADALSHRGKLVAALAVVRAQGLDALGDVLQIGLGGGQRDLKRPRIDGEEQRARLDLLIVAHPDLGHPPLDRGADGDDLGLHVSVLGGDALPASLVDVAGGGQDQNRRSTEQQAAQYEAFSLCLGLLGHVPIPPVSPRFCGTLVSPKPTSAIN